MIQFYGRFLVLLTLWTAEIVWKADDFFFFFGPPAAAAGSSGGLKRVCTKCSLDPCNNSTTVSLMGSLFLSNQPPMLYGT
jgi:hypothetical protein